MKPRIVLATDSEEPSGLGEHMLTLGEALGHAYDVTLAAIDHPAGRSLLARAAALGMRIKALDLSQSHEVRRWLGASDTALLHVHAGIGWEGHDLVRHGKAAGLPVVRTEHLPYLLTSPVQQAEYRAMLLNVDGRIAVSQAVHDSHVDQGGARQTIIRNGIKPHAQALDRDAVREGLGLDTTDKLLLTVARFSAQKGHGVLVDAAPTVLREVSHAKFVLVGTGPDEAAIIEKIRHAGLEQNFLLLGQRNDVPDLLAAADLFVLPSLFEGLSLAVLEAMAAGVPVVASDIGGTSEALGADHPYLTPPGDSGALAATILRALNSPEIGAAGRRRFDAQFTAARMAAETAALYQSILRQAEQSGARP